MKIKVKLILSTFFSIIFISILFWNRFLRKRLERELLPIENISFFFLITLVLAFCFTILGIYYSLKTVNFFNKKGKISEIIDNYSTILLKKQWFNNTIFFIYNYIISSIPYVYDYVYKYVYVKPFIEAVGRFLSNRFFNRVFIVYIFMYVLPKIVPVVILFIEIILTHRIYFFYKSLYLLLIPVCFNAILHMLDHHAKAVLDYYDYFFIIKNEPDTFHIHDRILENNEDKEIQKTFNADAIALNWGNAQCMFDIAFRIQQQKDKYSNFFRACYFTLLALCFILQVMFMLNANIL